MRSAKHRFGALMLVTLMAVSATAIAAELEPGTMAPDFTLMDASGTKHSLSDFEGKIVVLEWTNPTCPFVVRHYKAETMTDLYAKYVGEEEAKDTEVVWLAINSTHYNKAEETVEWSKENGLEYATLLDASGDVGRMYGAKTTPHMFVVGKDGKVLYNGAIDDDPRDNKDEPYNYVDAALTAALSGKAIEHGQTKPYGCSVKYAEKKSPAKTESR